MCLDKSFTILLQMDDGAAPSTSTDTTDSNGDATADPLSGIQAKKPKDFQVFINLVDFCRYYSLNLFGNYMYLNCYLYL